MDTNEHELENQSLPLKLRVLEIEKDANSEFGDAQVIEHLATLVISDLFDDFGVHDDSFERDEIGLKQADDLALVCERKGGLVLKRNSPGAELNEECIFVWLFMKAVPDLIEHFNRGANELKNFTLEQQFFIRVYSCSFVVELCFIATTCRGRRGLRAGGGSLAR
jgi:hypothetical protein